MPYQAHKHKQMSPNYHTNYFCTMSALIMILSTTSEGLECYKCGTSSPYSRSYSDNVEEYKAGAVNDESCHHFESEGSSAKHEVKCGPEQVCAKIVTHDVQPEGRVSTQRGCAYKTTAGGYEHPIGCGTLAVSNLTKSSEILNYDHVCYCKTNYCNSAYVRISPFFRLILAVTVLWLLC